MKDSQFQPALACPRCNYSLKADLFSLGWRCPLCRGCQSSLKRLAPGWSLRLSDRQQAYVEDAVSTLKTYGAGATFISGPNGLVTYTPTYDLIRQLFPRRLRVTASQHSPRRNSSHKVTRSGTISDTATLSIRVGNPQPGT